MIIRLRFLALWLVLALVLPLASRAQNQSDGTLHVLRPSINAEQDTAELCLEFDHALDRTNPGRILAGIHLQSDDKPIAVALPDLNLGSTSLCLQSLAHRQDYSLTLSDLRGAGGEKLTEAYKLSFTVPDRHPALAFAGDANSGPLARIKDNDPVLRAINVTRAKVSLFRITDPARMAEAYRQRLLTSLAPSENLAYAKDKVQLVWQDDLVLDDQASDKAANRNLEHPVPLHAAAGGLTPGLYLVVAEDTEPPQKSKTNDNIAPIAARWFLRSDLKIRAFRHKDGFTVETDKTDTVAVIKDVRLILFNRDDKIMAEATSDANGLGFLPVPQDKGADAASIIGVTKTGESDFADLSSGENTVSDNQFILPEGQSSMVANRPYYAPGTEAYLTLTARNLQGEAAAANGSSVQLLRPDHSVFTTIPVPDGKAGIYYASLVVPATGGLWTALWQQSDGRQLAEIPLRVTVNPEAPQLSITADRPMIANDGDVNLSLKSVTNNNAPAPYLAGHVLVQWVTPDSFAGWSDYHFGREDKSDQAAISTAAFITDAGGTARLHLNLKPPDDGAPLHTAMINLRSDPATGALDPDPFALPVRPNNTIVGIKPLAPGGKFAENSLAKFDVVVIDGDGKRHEDSGFKYQIYEEGRSFAWYQAEGRWEYKQLQQRRRIGGGTLDIKATGANIIRWPVTAGTYVVEVTDANGVVLARLHFNAGWGLLKVDQAGPGDLTLVADTASAQPGAPTRIKFKLDHPSVINAVIADEQIRKIIHEVRVAGDNQIAVTPEEGWGNRLRIRIEAEQKTDDGTVPTAGQIELPLRHQKKELGLATEIHGSVSGGQDFSFTVTVNNIDKRQPTFVSVLATPLAKDGNLPMLPAVLARDIAIGADGKALVRLTVPVFTGTLRLAITAVNQNQRGQKELSIPVETPFTADMAMPALLDVGDTVHLALNLQNNSAPANVYRYALSASPGFKLAGNTEGKENFPVKARKLIAIDLTALTAGAKGIKLDIFGPRDFHISRNWNFSVTEDSESLSDIVPTQIAPRQGWSSSEGKSSGKAPARKPDIVLAFITGQSLFNAPQILPSLIAATPLTTNESATWLGALRLWREPIIRAGLLSDNALSAREQDTLRRLLARQKPDGGFPVLPGGEGDLVSTSDALVALVRANQPLTQPAADAATGWLRQRLANTWFDENERPARAAAFAALAATDRLDVSSLRYFAETSAGKVVPPLAAAQLAVALAKSNDQDKAIGWLSSAREDLETTPELWPVLADNPLFDSHDLMPVLEKVSADLIKHPSHDPEKLASFLQAVWIVDNRSGNWRATINGAEKNQSGIFVVTPSEKATPITIQNLTDQPLYVVAAGPLKIVPPPALDAPIIRHFYRPDGTERAAGDLRRGEIYLVVLEGSVEGREATRLFLHDTTEMELRPLSCALDGGAGLPEDWNWLKNLSLNPVFACETGGRTVDAVLALPASDAKFSWHAAYLAKAEFAGAFNLPPAMAREEGGNKWFASGAQAVLIK